MFSRKADARAPGEGSPMKSGELKCFNCHSCPPSGSADRLSETVNLMVNMGLMLETKRTRLLVTRDGQSKRTVNMHFITKGGNGQPRTVVIQVNSILTEMNVVD